MGRAHSDGASMEYESNPKHSEPWQRGRRGSLCPKEVRPIAAELLDDSELIGGKRYAVHDGRAYCAQEHRAGVWQGYPVGWKVVPPELRERWRTQNRVRSRDIRKHWD